MKANGDVIPCDLIRDCPLFNILTQERYEKRLRSRRLPPCPASVQRCGIGQRNDFNKDIFLEKLADLLLQWRMGDRLD